MVEKELKIVMIDFRTDPTTFIIKYDLVFRDGDDVHRKAVTKRVEIQDTGASIDHADIFQKVSQFLDRCSAR